MMDISTVTHSARIVQEVMREDYGMPEELAVQLEHVLAGAGRALLEAGYEVGSIHIEYDVYEDGDTVPHAAIRMTENDESSAVVFEIRTYVDCEGERE